MMPRGDKSKYTDKQERKADHIAEGYEKRGVSEGEAERRAWATVNKESGGGNKSGSGAREEGHARILEEGWTHRRRGFRASIGRAAFGVSKEGCSNLQAKR
jgi:plasmid stabilization system protein ParE